jgi:hypothetical protein
MFVCPTLLVPPPGRLAEVVEGLLTKDVDTRLTLNALRFHPWLTDNDKQPLPMQPVMQVEVHRLSLTWMIPSPDDTTT